MKLLIAFVVLFLSAHAKPLRGVNLAGLEFAESTWPGVLNTNYASPTTAEIDYFLSKGMRVIRLPFLWERIQPQARGSFDQNYLRLITNLVKYTTQKGASIILDPHNYARYHHQILNNGDFADLWTKITQVPEFKDPRVIYALMNEPREMDTRVWFSAAQAGINAIRATGATNLILVPGNAWTGAHSWLQTWYGESNANVMINIRDPGNNFAFEVHQYLDADNSGRSEICVHGTRGSQQMRDFTNWCRQNGFKAFLGEWAGGRNQVCYDAIQDLVKFLDDNEDVYLGWTWWAGGPWWGDYLYVLDATERPQMKYLVSQPVAPQPTLRPVAVPQPVAPQPTRRPVAVPQPVAPQPTRRPVAVPQPVAPQPTPRPVSDSPSACSWHGFSNSEWYMQVLAATDVTTVRVTCTSGSVTCSKGWMEGNSQIWQCSPAPGTSCQGRQLSCGNGNREDGTSTPSAPLAGWAIALIVLGAVFAAVVVALAVFFFKRSDSVETV